MRRRRQGRSPRRPGSDRADGDGDRGVTVAGAARAFGSGGDRLAETCRESVALGRVTVSRVGVVPVGCLAHWAAPISVRRHCLGGCGLEEREPEGRDVLEEALELRLVAYRSCSTVLPFSRVRVIPWKATPRLSLSSPSTTNRYSRVGMESAWHRRLAVQAGCARITLVTADGRVGRARSRERRRRGGCLPRACGRAPVCVCGSCWVRGRGALRSV